MRSMQQQLGILGTISAFAYRYRETKKKPVPRWLVVGPSGYFLLASIRQLQQATGNHFLHSYRYRETKKKKNLCRGGWLQDLPATDFQPASGNSSKHLATISYTLIDTGKQRKTCAEVAGCRTFRLLTSSQHPATLASIRQPFLTLLQVQGNKEKPVPRWLVVGPSGY